MKLKVCLLVAAGVIAGSGGCATEPALEYVAPTGGESQACLEYCQGERFSCRKPIQRRDGDCQQRYRLLYDQFLRCVRIRGRDGGCIRPDGCPIPDYQVCKLQYDRCFVGCGGQIRELDETKR